MACYKPRWYTRPKTVTHPGTNRARRALTSFNRRTPLTTTPRRQPKYLLAVPRFRLNTYGRRAFSVAGPMAWNSFPDFIRDPTSSTDCLGVYLKRTCSSDTSASSALGVLNDYALHKSTHSLTHSDMLVFSGCMRPEADVRRSRRGGECPVAGAETTRRRPARCTGRLRRVCGAGVIEETRARTLHRRGPTQTDLRPGV